MAIGKCDILSAPSIECTLKNDRVAPLIAGPSDTTPPIGKIIVIFKSFLQHQYSLRF